MWILHALGSFKSLPIQSLALSPLSPTLPSLPLPSLPLVPLAPVGSPSRLQLPARARVEVGHAQVPAAAQASRGSQDHRLELFDAPPVLGEHPSRWR